MIPFQNPRVKFALFFVTIRDNLAQECLAHVRSADVRQADLTLRAVHVVTAAYNTTCFSQLRMYDSPSLH